MLLVPSLLLVGAATILSQHLQIQRALLNPCCLLLFSLSVAVVAALPTGYVQNIPRYGHPLGPEHVRAGHTLEGLSVSEKVIESGKNTLRYIVDSTSFDGVKRGGTIDDARDALVKVIGSSIKQLGWDLEQNDHSKREFFFSRPYRDHEDFSWWGVASILLIWPAIIYCFLTPRTNKTALTFALAFIVFLLCQSHAQYDPWRGRYFSWAIPILIVPVAYLMASLLKSRAGQTYLMLAIVAICITSSRAMLYRTNSYLIEKRNQQSIFKMDRITQLCRNKPDFAEVVRRYQKEVPEGASVMIAVTGEHFLYPFYGEGLDKTISYISPNSKTAADFSSDFLLFSNEKGRITPEQNDLLLGTETGPNAIFLRRR